MTSPHGTVAQYIVDQHGSLFDLSTLLFANDREIALAVIKKIASAHGVTETVLTPREERLEEALLDILKKIGSIHHYCSVDLPADLLDTIYAAATVAGFGPKFKRGQIVRFNKFRVDYAGTGEYHGRATIQEIMWDHYSSHEVSWKYFVMCEDGHTESLKETALELA